jgi:hypothetical protein
MKIEIRRIQDEGKPRRLRDAGSVGAGRGQWQKEARVDGGPWRYLLMAQQITGTKEWIVFVKDTETGKVLDQRSPDHRSAAQKELVKRLHEREADR